MELKKYKTFIVRLVSPGHRVLILEGTWENCLDLALAASKFQEDLYTVEVYDSFAGKTKYEWTSPAWKE